MTCNVSVIIPALNESENISGAIDSAANAGADEIIVVDGGSTDRTRELAMAKGARVIEAPKMRATQMNEGARAARGEALLFLHADTMLPHGACERVRNAVDAGKEFGGFLVSFDTTTLRLRLASQLINLRTRITQCPWGDQGQFFSRQLFTQLHGYREIEILEDYDIARRAKRATKVALIDDPVLTSSRRFRRLGSVRTVATNWRIIAGFHAGEDPARLAQLYRRR